MENREGKSGCWVVVGYILIKAGNCGKNSTKLVMSHRHLKNENYPMERDFLINWFLRTCLFEAAHISPSYFNEIETILDK